MNEKAPHTSRVLKPLQAFNLKAFTEFHGLNTMRDIKLCKEVVIPTF